MDLLAELIKETKGDEAWEAIIDHFKETYEPPTYAGEMCERCGVRVARSHIHDEYHRNLSLSMFVVQGFIAAKLEEQT